MFGIGSDHAVHHEELAALEMRSHPVEQGIEDPRLHRLVDLAPVDELLRSAMSHDEAVVR
jgi:hypothetical protein